MRCDTFSTSTQNPISILYADTPVFLSSCLKALPWLHMHTYNAIFTYDTKVPRGRLIF
jgi:hypothetical protein